MEASCTVVESSSSPRHAIAEFPLHWGKVLVLFVWNILCSTFFWKLQYVEVQDEFVGCNAEGLDIA